MLTLKNIFYVLTLTTIVLAQLGDLPRNCTQTYPLLRNTVFDYEFVIPRCNWLGLDNIPKLKEGIDAHMEIVNYFWKTLVGVTFTTSIVEKPCIDENRQSTIEDLLQYVPDWEKKKKIYTLLARYSGGRAYAGFAMNLIDYRYFLVAPEEIRGRNVLIVAHELGHNFGLFVHAPCPTCTDKDGCTIMNMCSPPARPNLTFSEWQIQRMRCASNLRFSSAGYNKYQSSFGATPVGCFADGHRRALVSYWGVNYKKETCLLMAQRAGHAYFGLQNSIGECYTGNTGYDVYGRTDRCTSKCDADRSQNCGGHWANYIYKVNPRNTLYDFLESLEKE